MKTNVVVITPTFCFISHFLFWVEIKLLRRFEVKNANSLQINKVPCLKHVTGRWQNWFDAKVKRRSPLLRQRAWSGCCCNKGSGANLGSCGCLRHDSQGEFSDVSFNLRNVSYWKVRTEITQMLQNIWKNKQKILRQKLTLRIIFKGDDCWPRWAWRTKLDNATCRRHAWRIHRRKPSYLSSELRLARGCHERWADGASAQRWRRLQLWRRFDKPAAQAERNLWSEAWQNGQQVGRIYRNR